MSSESIIDVDVDVFVDELDLAVSEPHAAVRERSENVKSVRKAELGERMSRVRSTMRAARAGRVFGESFAESGESDPA